MADLFSRCFPTASLSRHDLLSHPLTRILGNIYFMPLSWRKHILTTTRVQQSSDYNDRLQASIEDIQAFQVSTLTPNAITPAGYTLQDLRSDLNDIVSSVVFCSVLSYFVRAEAWENIDEITEQLQQSINKELAASQQQDRPQQINYDRVLPLRAAGRFDPLGSKSHFLNAFRMGLERVTNTWRVQRHIYIPHANPLKNVSSDTIERYHEARGTPSDLTRHVTTVDLLRHYAETGEKIQGIPEVRTAWRYNDLKPRVYYAGGGESYWPCLFIKDLSRDLLQCLPSTSPETRFDTTRLTQYSYVSEDYIMVTYDYTSFTTSLAELKFFLHFLSTSLDGIVIQVLDVKEGIVSLDIGEYFRQYNDSQDINPEFDITRLFDAESLVTLYQLRNGMLGVQGNINFSTLLHGISLGRFTNDTNNLVVGDDALVIILKRIFDDLIESVNKLGSVEKTKFSTWTSKFESSNEKEVFGSGWQFCKRPLDLDYNGQTVAGLLFDYPNLAPVFLKDNFHVSTPATLLDLAHSLPMKWASFLHRIHLNLQDFTEYEAVFCTMPMIRCYRKFGLPYETGCLPNTRITSGELKGCYINIFVPPASVSTFTEQWEDLLSKSYQGSTVTMPRMVDHSISPGYISGVGHTVVGTTHRLQRLMISLGYLKEEGLREEVTIDEYFGDRLKKLVGGRLRPVKEFTCILQMPAYYNDIVYYEDNLPIDSSTLASVDIDLEMYM
jgi:hypothetical protein